MIKRLTRPFWLLLAGLFLAEAWLWDRLTELGHRIADRLPLEALRRRAAAVIERLPPWGALTLFIIPVILVQPIKLASLWLMMRGHIVLGALGFVGIKVVGFGAVAVLFDLTRDKLLTVRWFAWSYRHVIWLRALATAFVAPYRKAVAAFAGRIKRRALALFGAGEGRSRIARLRSKMRAR